MTAYPANQIIWRRQCGGKLRSPYVMMTADHKHLFVASEASIPKTDTIQALDIETGQMVWAHTLRHGYVSSGLVCNGAYLIISQEYLLSDGETETDLIALYGEDGGEAWRCRLPVNRLAPAVVVGDDLFVVASNRLGFVIDAQTGQLKRTLTHLPDALGTRPFVHPTGIYITGHGAEIGRVDPQSWSLTPFFTLPDSDNWLGPEIAGSSDRIITSSWRRKLLAIDTRNGRITWQASLERGASSPPVIGTHVYIGVKRRQNDEAPYGLAAFNLEDGSFAWFYGAEKHIEAPPLVVGDYVCVATRSGHFAVLEAANGQVVWTADFDERLYGAPLAVGPFLFVGKRSGEIVAFLWPEQGGLQSIDSPELDLAAALRQKDWETVRQLAFDLDQFELEAEACLHLAAETTGETSLDYQIEAGQAIIRAARMIEQQLEADPEDKAERQAAAADLWEKGGNLLKEVLGENELVQQCRHEMYRLRRWPDIRLDVSAVRELVAGQFDKLQVLATNVGGGTARRVVLRVLGSRFEGDVNTQHMPSIRPEKSQLTLLRVKPNLETIGSAVPLDLELSYQLPNGETLTRQVRGEVTVLRDDAGRLPTTDKEQLMTRPRMGVYYESSQYDPRIKWKRLAPLDLRQNMVTYFTLDEVQTLCSDLGINYDMLRGNHLDAKVRELIIACEKYELVVDLIHFCREVYPHVDWGDVAADHAGDMV